VKALVVALVVGVVCVSGAGPADAAEGSKQFLKDCTLQMLGSEGRGGIPFFEAYDGGTECGEYAIRGISLVTASGRYLFSGLDGSAEPAHEWFTVSGPEPEDFAYGTVDVYIPYRARCDRYRLYASNAVRFLDSRQCSALPTVKGTDVGGYRVTVSGTQSVGATFKVTGGTCNGQVSGAGQGVRLGSSSQHGAWLHHFCAKDGSLKYLADALAGGSESVVQKPTAVGDKMRVSVRSNGTTATATVRNLTKGWTHSVSGPAGGSPSPARIGTFPLIGIGPPPLARFAPVAFTNVTIGSQFLGQWTATRVRLADSEGNVQVQPTAITDGTGFTNTWKHA